MLTTVPVTNFILKTVTNTYPQQGGFANLKDGVVMATRPKTI